MKDKHDPRTKQIVVSVSKNNAGITEDIGGIQYSDEDRLQKLSHVKKQYLDCYQEAKGPR